MNELVSVIVPIYKVEKYIRKCLDSILNQSYENLEIILVNDGSPDNTEEVAMKYCQKDNRFKYIYQESPTLITAGTVANTFAAALASLNLSTIPA